MQVPPRDEISHFGSALDTCAGSFREGARKRWSKIAKRVKSWLAFRRRSGSPLSREGWVCVWVYQLPHGASDYMSGFIIRRFCSATLSFCGVIHDFLVQLEFGAMPRHDVFLVYLNLKQCRVTCFLQNLEIFSREVIFPLLSWTFFFLEWYKVFNEIMCWFNSDNTLNGEGVEISLGVLVLGSVVKCSYSVVICSTVLQYSVDRFDHILGDATHVVVPITI